MESRGTLFIRLSPEGILTAFLCAAVAVVFGAAGVGSAEEPPPPSGAVLELERGRPAAREIRPGDVHSYGLTLAQGAAASIEVERFGAPVVVGVSAPDGRRIGTFGTSTARLGILAVSFAAETAGSYRIDVRTFLPPDPPGRYEVRALALEVGAAPVAGAHCTRGRWKDVEGRFLPNDALRDLGACLAATARGLAVKFPQVKELAGAAGADAEYMAGRWRWGEAVDPDYEEQLVADYEALASAAEGPDGKRTLEVLREVAADLRLKAEHCRRSGVGLGGRVKVVVKTKRDGKETGGFLIYYLRPIYKYIEGFPAERFPAQSSPTEQELSPSKYYIWAEKPGLDTHVPPKGADPIAVGFGDRRKELDIPVP